MVEARRRFASLIAQPESRIDLAHAALLIAKEEESNFSVAHYLSLLDELGGEARNVLSERQDETGSTVEAFNRFMFEHLGFAGNAEDYYDPRNSLLNHVIDRRRGIPITLSIVYMEIGRRAGLTVDPIGLPGHFIVRAAASQAMEDATLVDPFNRRTLDLEDCQAQLDAIYGGQVALAPQHLRTATTKEILTRLLRNLEAIYINAKLYRQVLSITERILLIAPNSFEERRARAVAFAELERLPEAIHEFEIYLKVAPKGAAEVDRTREQLNALKSRQSRLN